MILDKPTKLWLADKEHVNGGFYQTFKRAKVFSTTLNLSR